jgi:hypothetical protein
MRQRCVWLVLLVSAAALLCQGAEVPPSLAGRWEGAVQIPGTEMKIVVDLAQQGATWVGSATVPGYGVKGAQLVGFAVKGNDVEFGFKRALDAAKFTVHIDSDGTLKGEFTQGGNKAPFALKRTGEAQVEFPKVSTAISKELQGEWRGTYQFVTMKLNVILKLSGDPAKPGEFVVTDWGNTSFPVDLWTEDGSKVTFVAEAGGITYEGEFRKDTAEIAGTIRQSIVEQPLALKRAATN